MGRHRGSRKECVARASNLAPFDRPDGGRPLPNKSGFVAKVRASGSADKMAIQKAPANVRPSTMASHRDRCNRHFDLSRARISMGTPQFPRSTFDCSAGRQLLRGAQHRPAEVVRSGGSAILSSDDFVGEAPRPCRGSMSARHIPTYSRRQLLANGSFPHGKRTRRMCNGGRPLRGNRLLTRCGSRTHR